MITTREEYNYALARGYDALLDERFPMDIALRKEIQKEKFGGNNARGNSVFYRYCLENKPLVCEECGRPIDYPSAVNVSHILTRGAHPAIAHDPRNTNILCFEHHQRWENGDRKSMRIYPKNEKTILQLKKEYYNV
jgi:hypothetical protein